MTSHSQDTSFFSLTNLQMTLNYIEENLLEKLTPTKIAAQFFVSTSTLTSLFKIACGMTIMEYIRNRRLTLAAEELSSSNVPIIDLAYKYGYDTPEAFTKAFSRFHGFPPSFVRRGFPIANVFLPLQINVTMQGGWNHADLTKSNRPGQDQSSCFSYNRMKEQIPSPKYHYNTFIMEEDHTIEEAHAMEETHSMEEEHSMNRGGSQMNCQNTYQIDLNRMQFQKEWAILCSLAESLLQNQIPFKVDGKTMIFAHGLEFPLEKICLTFKWGDEETVRSFFHYDSEDSAALHTEDNFKYFDTLYSGIKIRCMFYGNCLGADTDEFLYRNTDSVQIGNLLLPVQSLEFYYENTEQDTPYYRMVARRLEKPENYRIRNKNA